MKYVKQNQFTIVRDDGTQLPSWLLQDARWLVQKFLDSRVLGDNTPVGEIAALRMAEVVLSSGHYVPTFRDREECEEYWLLSGPPNDKAAKQSASRMADLWDRRDKRPEYKRGTQMRDVAEMTDSYRGKWGFTS